MTNSTHRLNLVKKRHTISKLQRLILVLDTVLTNGKTRTDDFFYKKRTKIGRYVIWRGSSLTRKECNVNC